MYFKKQITYNNILISIGMLFFISLVYFALNSWILNCKRSNLNTISTKELDDISRKIDEQIFNSRIKVLTKLASDKNLSKSIINREYSNSQIILTLENYKTIIDAQFVYILDTTGTTIFSTTDSLGILFTGKNYSFRYYFKQAMKGKSVVYPAVGITTKKRGLYFSKPIYKPSSQIIIAVAVIKVSAEEIDKILSGNIHTVVLISPDGIIFAGNKKSHLLKRILLNKTADYQPIQNARQFDYRKINRVTINEIFDSTIIISHKISLKTSTLKHEIYNWQLLLGYKKNSFKPLLDSQKSTITFTVIFLTTVIIFLCILLYFLKQFKTVRNKYRAIAENANEGIIVLNLSGETLYCNNKFYSMGGITDKSEQNIRNIDVISFISEEFQKDVQIYFKKRSNNENVPPYFETKAIKKDGTPIWILISPTNITWGNEPSILIFIINITSRKNIEQALAKSEKMYRGLIETMNEGLIVLDDNKNVTFVNNEFCNLIGVKKQELIGVNIEKLFENRAFSTIIDFDNNYKPIRKEIKFTTADNKIKTVVASPAKILDDNSNISGTFTLISDITEFKALQEKVNAAQKLETLGKMAGTVAHDLNNILSGIVTIPDILLLESTSNDPNRELFKTIKSSGEKAAAVVEDLLTVSRRAAIVKDIFCVNTIIREYIKSLEFSQLKDRNPEVNITFNLEKTLANIEGSRIHIVKTIMNMTSNAVESIKGSGNVSITTRTNPITQAIVIEISDTGSGINKDDIKKIFDPFYSTKVMGMSGTGLGLTIVNATVRDLGGYIDIKSKIGKGTTFSIFIPECEKEAPALSKQKSIDNLKGNGEQILVVDDNPIQREMVLQTLKRLNYNILIAKTGENAIEILKKETVDLVILDMILGDGMDGLNTCKEAIKINSKLKVIIVSGYAETNRVKEALRISKGVFIKKPYTLNTIAENIKTELELSFKMRTPTR